MHRPTMALAGVSNRIGHPAMWCVDAVEMSEAYDAALTGFC